MLFTAIHRALGHAPGPLTAAMLNEAVASGVAETDDLDWKRDLPPTGGVATTDFPKDIAAMANTGGGMIVYGVTETGKRASGRADVGSLTEGHERTLRSAAMSAITPPVLNLQIMVLKSETSTAVAVVVPASVDGPHLVYRNQFFGAPTRVDADTHWMREPELEGAYRTRLEERRAGAADLDSMYDEQLANRGIADSGIPWIVCVARPRQQSSTRQRLRPEEVPPFWRVVSAAQTYADLRFPHPLQALNTNPRAGLRRVTFAPQGESTRWGEAWASLHDNGCVSLSSVLRMALRAGERQDPQYERVPSVTIEAAIADFLALVWASGQRHTVAELEILIGVEWSNSKRLLLVTTDSHGEPFDGTSVPLARYSRLYASINAQVDPDSFHRQAHAIAQDAINQGGITWLRYFKPPPPEVLADADAV